MIFVDSNVAMYLIGAPHPNKDRAVTLLTQLVSAGERFITDVEVYQEILHRYTAIRRLEAIEPAFDSLDRIVDEVLTYGMAEIRTAKELIGSIDGFSARDALHVSIMRKSGANLILSFDAGFDYCPDISRLS